MAEAMGLSKRAVQGVLAMLAHRRLIGVERTAPTAVRGYRVLRPWDRTTTRAARPAARR